MALSAFEDKAHPPDQKSLGRTLGKAFVAWKTVTAGTPGCAALAEEWGFTSAAAGWSLRLKDGKRVIVYMTPQEGHFLASLALGEKAVVAARTAGLPRALLAAIEAAPRYAEGRGLRVEVRTVKEARAIAALAGIKRTS